MTFHDDPTIGEATIHVTPRLDMSAFASDVRTVFAAAGVPAPAQVQTRGGSPADTSFARFQADGRYPYMRTANRDIGGQWSDLTVALAMLNQGEPAVECLVDEAPLGSPMGAGVFAVEAFGAVVQIDCDPSWDGWSIRALADSSSGAEAAVEMFLELLPPAINLVEESLVRCTIWMKHPMGGATSRYSTLARTPFADVADNYPAAIRPSLDEMCAMTAPSPDGRLAVFHGPPGTGKTRFLFSLASEWADWCDIHYVMDPEELFSNAAYLTSILMDAERSDRWSILVMEDGDEFIDVSAKAKVGQGLSRLLNVADGFIGQAAKMMVLISTNVEHESFQPAAVRAGRCFANYEFPAFTAPEAAVWLEAHTDRGDGEPEVEFAAATADEPMTLADLYQAAR